MIVSSAKDEIYTYIYAPYYSKQNPKKERATRSLKSSNMKRRKPNDHFLRKTLLLSPHQLTTSTTATIFLHTKPADGARLFEMRHRQPSPNAVRVELMPARQHRRAPPTLQARQAHGALGCSCRRAAPLHASRRRITLAARTNLVWRQEKSEYV